MLLPAFVLGCIIYIPPECEFNFDKEERLCGPGEPTEQLVSAIVSAIFMVSVGLSMPVIFGEQLSGHGSQGARAFDSIIANVAVPSPGILAVHVVLVTIVSNIGKLLPVFFYRKEAHWKERLALSIGLWPRGEVGAGVLFISLGYGIGGPVVTVAILSLALNLLLTGAFIVIIKKILAGLPQNAIL